MQTWKRGAVWQREAKRGARGAEPSPRQQTAVFVGRSRWKTSGLRVRVNMAGEVKGGERRLRRSLAIFTLTSIIKIISK